MHWQTRNKERETFMYGFKSRRSSRKRRRHSSKRLCRQKSKRTQQHVFRSTSEDEDTLSPNLERLALMFEDIQTRLPEPPQRALFYKSLLLENETPGSTMFGVRVEHDYDNNKVFHMLKLTWELVITTEPYDMSLRLQDVEIFPLTGIQVPLEESVKVTANQIFNNATLSDNPLEVQMY